MRLPASSALALLALILSACGATGVHRDLAACPAGDLHPLNPGRWHWQGQPGLVAPTGAVATSFDGSRP